MGGVNPCVTSSLINIQQLIQTQSWITNQTHFMYVTTEKLINYVLSRTHNTYMPRQTPKCTSEPSE